MPKEALSPKAIAIHVEQTTLIKEKGTAGINDAAETRHERRKRRVVNTSQNIQARFKEGMGRNCMLCTRKKSTMLAYNTIKRGIVFDERKPDNVRC